MAKLKVDKLITYAFMREECDLPDVIRDEELENKIYQAQEMLRMLMGDGFYQDYLVKFKAESFNTVETTLLSYVKQFVAWQAHQEWVLKANFKIHAGGFRVHSETNSTPATDAQMAMLLKDAKYKSDYYKRLMVDYLNAHCSDYPLYDCSCGKNLTGNGFHISAVKNKYKDPQPYGTRKRCCE